MTAMIAEAIAQYMRERYTPDRRAHRGRQRRSRGVAGASTVAIRRHDRAAIAASIRRSRVSCRRYVGSRKDSEQVYVLVRRRGRERQVTIAATR